MSSFTLPSTDPPVTVKLTADFSKDQLMSFPAFNTWFSTLQHSLSLQCRASHPFHAAPYLLRHIEIQAADFFGEGRLGFLKFQAEVSNEEGERLPGSIFLRGGSVCMMLLLQPDDIPPHTETDKHVILTLQPRVPAGSLNFVELPAGMLDDSGTLSGAAAKEIEEETGLKIETSELTNLTELALSALPAGHGDDEEHLQAGLYPSPGGSDEYIPIFLWQKRIPRDQLQEWTGKLTGLRDEGEKITLKLTRLEDLWKVGVRDGKTLAAYALYEGLRRTGKL